MSGPISITGSKSVFEAIRGGARINWFEGVVVIRLDEYGDVICAREQPSKEATGDLRRDDIISDTYAKLCSRGIERFGKTSGN